MELFRHGENSSKTLHEIIKQLPWSWDQTKRYFDPLEDIGMIKSSRDSEGQKIYYLDVKKKQRARQLTNLIEYFKQKGLIWEEISEEKSKYHEYYSKLSEWFDRQKTIQQAKNLKQVLPSVTEKFIHEITTLIINTQEDDLEQHFVNYLKKRPLLIKSLERRS